MCNSTWIGHARDKRDISTGQTGHVHGMVAVHKWGGPAEFLYVHWFFSLPIHKHFSDGPCGTIVPGPPVPGQNADVTVEFSRKRPVCQTDRRRFVPGTGPVCCRDGSCLSRTPSCPKCSSLFFLSDKWYLPVRLLSESVKCRFSKCRFGAEL